MDMITVSAKTVDEAVTKALIELETTSDKLEYEVGEFRILRNRRKAGGNQSEEERADRGSGH